MSDDRVTTLRLVTRGYELGASGMVELPAYLRYLEHTRWWSMTGRGTLPLQRLWGLGVIRAQKLELYTTVSFHVELELALWLSRVGRTSFDISHRVTRVSDGAVVAFGIATAVALDGERRPREVSKEAHDYVIPGEDLALERPTGQAPAECWGCEVLVRPSDEDLQRHVNHARYADYISDARRLCAEAGGYGPGEWQGHARAISLEYDREAHSGEVLRVRTWRVPGTERDLEFQVESEAGVLTRARVALAASGWQK